MSHFDKFPILQLALFEMAYDNGAINRERTEESVIESGIASLVGYSDEDLAEVSAELSTLTLEELGTVCTGDQDDPVCKARSAKLNDVLNALFESL